MLAIKLLFLLPLVGVISEKRSSIYLERLDNCPGYNNLTTLFKNTQIRLVDNAMIINYDIQVVKDSRGPLGFFWEIERCSNKENLNSCSKFAKIRSSKYCEFLISRNDAWSPLFECLQPKIKCPLKKGIHRGTNCTVDTSAFRFFPLQGSYWRFRAFVLERKLIRMCLDVFGYMKEYYS